MMLTRFFKALLAPFSSPLNHFEATLIVKPKRQYKPTGPRSDVMKAIAALEFGELVDVTTVSKASSKQLIKQAKHHRPGHNYVAYTHDNQRFIERVA